jgi:hypothetical protein
MSQLERLLKMAEDELTQYSTDARKMEKLGRKIGLSISLAEQGQIKEELLATIPSNKIAEILEVQRQAAALPFWGIAALGLLFGISLNQPISLLAAIVGTVAAFRIQKWGWQLQAKCLLLRRAEDLEACIAKPNK